MYLKNGHGYHSQHSVRTPHMIPCSQRPKNLNIPHSSYLKKVSDDEVFPSKLIRPD